MKKTISLLLILAVSLIVISCGDDNVVDNKNSANLITSFRFDALSATGNIDNNLNIITVGIPKNTDKSALIPTIEVSQGATISPASGAAQNFTNDVQYVVTAENGNKRTYTVKVVDIVEFMPLAQGYSWVYSSNTIDTTGNEMQPPYTDSSAVTGTETKDGKTAFVLTNFRFRGGSQWDEMSKQYFYNENGKTYMHSSYLTNINYNGTNVDLGIQGQWLLYIDNSANQWTLLDSVKTDTVELNLGTMILDVTGYLTIKAKKVGTEKVIVEGVEKDAVKFEYTAVLNGKAGGALPISTTVVRTYWYVEGIGVVKQRTNNGIITYLLGSAKTPGEVSTLLRAHVSK